MTIAESLVGELDREMATTRKLLERVPDSDGAWRPHPKSMSMGELAQHIVNLLKFGEPAFSAKEFDFANPANSALWAAKYQSTRTLVEMFDGNLAAARKAISAASDDALRGTWTLRVGPREIFTMPRSAVVRSFIISHIIHHRGQLSVYLRLKDVPLPPIYGPTADEQL